MGFDYYKRASFITAFPISDMTQKEAEKHWQQNPKYYADVDDCSGVMTTRGVPCSLLLGIYLCQENDTKKYPNKLV